MAALVNAAELEPNEPDFLRNLAELARESGDRASAHGWMRRAAEATARNPTLERLNLLAAGWIDLGERGEAVETAAQALALQDNTASRHLFAASIRRADTIPRLHRPLLVRALKEGWLGGDLLLPAVVILRNEWLGSTEELAQDELLAAVLTLGPIKDPVLEHRLTELRRGLLSVDLSAAVTTLWANLAAQCFINEYAWRVTHVERAEIDVLMRRRSPEALLKLAAYMPLGSLPDAAELLHREWPQELAAVLQQQIAEPFEERRLGETLPALTPIREGTSQAVRAMYEANPYPRWVKAGVPQPQPLVSVFRSNFPRAELAPIPNADAPHVLVAGCGSGSHAIAAAGRYSGATVLAVDLSRASLGYAARKAREAGCTNITFAQADLLELGSLKQRFDVIECGGVLHHLRDPREGARVLGGLLRPGGIMVLGLYSAAARAAYRPAQAMARGYAPDTEGIRALRAAIHSAPEGEPVRDVFGSGDFYSTSACRDLLMHVQEHQLSTADLRRILDESGLRLGGFMLPPEVITAYRSRFPDDPAAVNLDNWHAFEADRPETFRTMYKFWAQKRMEA
jgi:2-polyprenyl-3-methyl-5-hydroxy-6-metoxy-1,4-benzoquinol methylase